MTEDCRDHNISSYAPLRMHKIIYILFVDRIDEKTPKHVDRVDENTPKDSTLLSSSIHS